MKNKIKRVVMIHGWGGAPDEGWRPWITKELESKGFEVLSPAMPNPNFPKQHEWVDHLSSVMKTLDESVILIGHSLGVITILRYLESLREGQKIGRAIFVAGFTDDLGIEELKNFFQTPIQWKKIKKACHEFVSIESDNDPYDLLKYNDEFKKHLKAKAIVVHNMKHFSGDDGVAQVPQILEAVLQ